MRVNTCTEREQRRSERASQGGSGRASARVSASFIESMEDWGEEREPEKGMSRSRRNCTSRPRNSVHLARICSGPMLIVLAHAPSGYANTRRPRSTGCARASCEYHIQTLQTTLRIMVGQMGAQRETAQKGTAT